MSTVTLEKLLSRPGFVVMDGGMGTAIEDAGFSVANPLWGSAALLTEDARATNRNIHEDFINAGAELLIANTHNASLAACTAYLEQGFEVSDGFRDPTTLLKVVNALGVDSAKHAAGKHEVLIAGCTGSTEAAYAKTSTLDARTVSDRMRPQLAALTSTPIDLLILEMISTHSELEGLAPLLAELRRDHPELPVAVGFTCGERGTTHGGVSMSEAVRAFAGAPPRLYFVQCTRYDLVERPLVELIDAAGDARKVGVYANDGREWRDQKWHGERVRPKVYGDYAARWAKLGVSVIGGCCGTGPLHVAALTRLRAKIVDG